MNRENPYRQKTDQTRQRIDRHGVSESNGTGLPPRSEIHRSGRKKSKRKISFPLLRLLVLFFILLPITVLALYTYQDSLFPGKHKQTVKDDSGGYETISIESRNVESTTNQQESNKKLEAEEKEAKAEDVHESEQEEATQTNTTASKKDDNSSSDAAVSTNEDVIQPSENNQTTGSKSDINAEMKKHQVQPGETLYRIAMKYYHSKSGINIIKKENGLTSNEIYSGQILNIPIY